MSIFDKLRKARCRLCGKNISPEDGVILIHGRSDTDMRTVIFSSYESVSMEFLNRLGVRLHLLDDIRQDVYLCKDCMRTKFLPVAEARLNELKKRYLEAKGTRAQADKNHYIELIGGIGRFGVPNALFLLLELYYLDGKSIPYLILELSVRLLKDGDMSWSTLDERNKRAILENLMKEIERADRTRYYWSTPLSYIESLMLSGVRLENTILEKVKEWESIAAHDISTGKTSDRIWGANAETGASKAREVLTKAKKILGEAESSRP